MKMHDVGKKPKKSETKEMAIGMSNEIRYPYLSMDSEQFPPAKEMQVGKEFMMQICAKPSRISIDKDGKVNVDMDIKQMGMMEKEKSDDDKMNSMVDKMYPDKK